jgi:hypothetical protein
MMSSHNDIICDIWCDRYQNASNLVLILDVIGYTICGYIWEYVTHVTQGDIKQNAPFMMLVCYFMQI